MLLHYDYHDWSKIVIKCFRNSATKSTVAAMYRHAFVLNAFQKIGPIEVKPLFWNKAVRAGRT